MVRARWVAAWVLLIGAVIGWPISAVTFAASEPPFILGLSWLAIIVTALDLLSTTDVRRQAEDDD